MKRLQPLHNKATTEALLKFFALLHLPSATLITFDQSTQNEVEELCSETRGLCPQLLHKSQVSENFTFEFSQIPVA